MLITAWLRTVSCCCLGFPVTCKWQYMSVRTFIDLSDLNCESSCHSFCECQHSQVAANPWMKPTMLDHKSVYRLLLSNCIVAFLLLFSLKVDMLVFLLSSQEGASYWLCLYSMFVMILRKNENDCVIVDYWWNEFDVETSQWWIDLRTPWFK